MNIIFIMSDTFRYDHCGFNGCATVKTPNLDRFAAESAIFDNAYSDNLPTLPNRASLLLGRCTWPELGWEPLPADKACLPQLLHEQGGYDTALVGDTVPVFTGRSGYTRDFGYVKYERGHAGRGNPPRLQAVEVDVAGYVPPGREYKQIEQLVRYLKFRSDWKSSEDCLAARSVRNAIEWLDSRKNDDPFLLWLDIWDPHEPWDPGEEFVALYPKPDIGWRTYYPPGGKQEDTGLTDEEMEAVRATYAAMVTQTDHYLGRLLDCARAKGLMENTLVIFTTDHGTHLGKGKWGHGILRKNRPWPFEELAHTPLLIHHPEGHGVGQRFRTFVQPFDLTATMLDFAGLEIPGNMDGRSLLGVLSGSQADIRDCALAGHHNMGRGVFSRALYTEDWFYGEWYLTMRGNPLLDDTLPPHLCERKTDPHQLDNILPQNMEKAAKVRARMIQYIQQTQAFREGRMTQLMDPGMKTGANF